MIFYSRLIILLELLQCLYLTSVYHFKKVKSGKSLESLEIFIQNCLGTLIIMSVFLRKMLGTHCGP